MFESSGEAFGGKRGWDGNLTEELRTEYIFMLQVLGASDARHSVSPHGCREESAVSPFQATSGGKQMEVVVVGPTWSQTHHGLSPTRIISKTKRL